MLIILLILIFCRPFISSLAFPYQNLAYSELTLALLIIWLIQKRLPFKGDIPIKYALLFFILAISVSIIFSKDKVASLKESYKYACGLLLFITVASLSPAEKSRVLACILAAASLISLLAIYQYYFGFQHLLKNLAGQGQADPFALDYITRRRPFFPFVTPNTLAGYLAMILPLAFASRNKAWVGVMMAAALLLTKSLGAVLSVFSGMAVYFCLRGNLKKTGFAFLAAILIAAALIFIARYAIAKQHTHPLFSLTMRLNYWRDTLRIILTHPLTGVGLGNFNLAYSRYAHNSYLQIWAETGTLGIASFLWLVTALVKTGLDNLRHSEDKRLAAGLIAAQAVFLFHNLFDFTFFLPEVALIWWVINGILSPGSKVPA